MKIAVVDDHDLIREGMKTVLMNHGAENVNIFGTGTELTASIDADKSFDLYIIDLELPDIDGFDLIKRIRTRNHKARIIVSTVHDEIWTLRKLLAHHVNAIIYKSGNANELVTAISEILQGKNYYCEGVEQQLKIAEDDSLHPTTRELEVLNQIARGKTSREIAAALFVSDNTIEAHRKSLFSKLGAVNVADLIVKAMDKGYIRKNCQ
ncbi:MAG: response regulator transcription factor [Muribaculaceae bacterium]|nr:response regulator transcription factor [Muribaculaceae bacterium]